MRKDICHDCGNDIKSTGSTRLCGTCLAQFTRDLNGHDPIEITHIGEDYIGMQVGGSSPDYYVEVGGFEQQIIFELIRRLDRKQEACKQPDKRVTPYPDSVTLRLESMYVQAYEMEEFLECITTLIHTAYRDRVRTTVNVEKEEL